MLQTLTYNNYPSLAVEMVRGAMKMSDEDSISLGLAMREQICAFENSIQSVPEEYHIPIPQSVFHFTGGVVCKETFMPKDTVLTGVIYKKPHIFSVLRGKVTHITEFGVETLTAPYVGSYPANIKRVAIIEEDCLASLCVHSEAMTEEEYNQDVVASSYTELGQYDPNNIQEGLWLE